MQHCGLQRKSDWLYTEEEQRGDGNRDKEWKEGEREREMQ
jgi:hypothetical protein